jgi:hypothetical protein
MPPVPEPFVCELPGPEAVLHLSFLADPAHSYPDGVWSLGIVWQRIQLQQRIQVISGRCLMLPVQLVDVPVGTLGCNGLAVNLTMN